jgi:hypothetical protein
MGYFALKSSEIRHYVKVAPQEAMQAQMGSRGIILLILNLGAKWELVVNATPRPIYL